MYNVVNMLKRSPRAGLQTRGVSKSPLIYIYNVAIKWIKQNHKPQGKGVVSSCPILKVQYSTRSYAPMGLGVDGREVRHVMDDLHSRFYYSPAASCNITDSSGALLRNFLVAFDMTVCPFPSYHFHAQCPSAHSLHKKPPHRPSGNATRKVCLHHRLVSVSMRRRGIPPHHILSVWCDNITMFQTRNSPDSFPSACIRTGGQALLLLRAVF